jgi:hypothetical protein
VRRFLVALAGLFALCAGLTGAVATLAHRDPPPRVAALLPDPDCAPPCWQGLRPGATAPSVLQAWMDHPPHDWRAVFFHERGSPPGFDNWEITAPDGVHFDISVVRIQNPRIDRLLLTAPDLRLGDVLAALGPPDSAEVGNLPGPRGVIRLVLRLVYRDYELAVEGMLGDRPVMTADTPVSMLLYAPLPDEDAPAWYGFGRLHTP